MYWCDNCKTFHEDEMIKYIEETHGERFAVCGHCSSEEIEPADLCGCGQPKKEKDDYCGYCEDTLNAITYSAVSEIAALIDKPLWEAGEELVRRVESIND